MSNSYRKLCADAIENNGGYSRGYHERAALSWNVAIDWGIPDFDKMLANSWEQMDGHGLTEEEFRAVVTAERLEEAAQEWDDEAEQNSLWDIVRDDMARGVSDADTYRTYRREVGRRYGLSSDETMPRKYRRKLATDTCYYPASTSGWVIVNPWQGLESYEVEFEFMGRQGKHLCVTEFEGRGLGISADDLADNIRNDSDGAYPNVWCQRLLAMIHEWDLCFSREAVKQEFHYQVGFHFAQRMREVYDECEAEAKEAAERQACAERDIMTV
jgi:hypothetical protein